MLTCITCNEPMNGGDGQDECAYCYYGRMWENRDDDPYRIPKEGYKYYFKDAASMAGLERAYEVLQRAVKDHGVMWAMACYFWYFEGILEDLIDPDENLIDLDEIAF